MEEFIQYQIFKSFSSVFAFTTTKKTFEIALPRFTGDNLQEYKPNRELLAKKLGIQMNQLVFPRQTHSNCVAEISSIPENEIKETDALITNLTGICLCVQTADCVPILIFDPNKKVIAAVHAGWRGTVKKIVETAIQKMVMAFGSIPENIVAAIGPSIGPKVYEVGDEVVQSVINTFQKREKLLVKNASGKFHFNLWEANKQILMENQVLPKNIEILGECSFELNDKYFSARKEGITAGRMVSGIILNS